MRSNHRWLSCVVAVLVVAACGDDDGGTTPTGDTGPRDMGGGDTGPDRDMGPQPDCETDDDCTGDQLCVGGECVDPPADCMVDEDCEAGFVCTPAGVCAPAPTECETDADCDPDGISGGLFLCIEGMCGPADLTECPPADILDRVCAIASVDSFCAEDFFVSCGAGGNSCELCDGGCDPDTGCDEPPPVDAGPPDMGPPPVDMGPPPADMGPPPSDMGPPDTGPPADMGGADTGPMTTCGNGMVEAGEDCDGIASATCDTPGCDADCHFVAIAPGCGNGCAEAGEACGEPGLAMCAAGTACVGCACVVTCGNGVADAGEMCGEPGLSCGDGQSCNATTCQCVPSCGDGDIDPGEACDPPNAPSCTSSSYCTPTCQLMPRPAMCGNGCIDATEECGEPGLPGCPDGSRCDSRCRCLANCGNGLIEGSETCDPPQPVPTGATGCAPMYCNEFCEYVPRPRACGNGCTESGEECNEPGFGACPMGESCTASCECVPPCTTEDFEAGTWPHAPWVAVGGNVGSVSASFAHDGSFGVRIEDPGFAGWYYRTDVSLGVGGEISAWVRGGSGRWYMGFDAGPAGAKSFVIGWNTSQILFQENVAYGFANVASASQAFMAGRWYRIEIEIQAGGTAVGRLYDQDGTTLLNTLSHTFAGGIGAGGIAIRAFSEVDGDTIQACPLGLP